jgi:hypothetical protein
MRPLHCAIFPHLGARHPKGYVQTGSKIGIDDNAVYLSIEGLEQVALKFLDVVRRDELREVQERVAELERRNLDLQEQVREADRFAEAAEYTLGRFGSKVQKKPGRRPQAPQEA